jgi:hypothetical protein
VVVRRRGARPPAAAVGWAALAALSVLAAGCGDEAAPPGAAAPARPTEIATTSAQASTPTETAGVPDPSSEAAVQVVAAYYREINDASVAGRVADVSGTALEGCQRCIHDVATTRLIDQRGLRADVGPYAVSDLDGGEAAGVGARVEFTVALVAVRMLDPADREAERTAAGPTRRGTAELSLTGNGWRIRSIDYAAG